MRPLGDRGADPRSAVDCPARPGPGPTSREPSATSPHRRSPVGTGMGGRSNASPTTSSPNASTSTPTATPRRRDSDGRSVWHEPTSPHFTSPTILAEEERILTWAIDAQLDEPPPSATVDTDGLDVLQADAAAAVAGQRSVGAWWSDRPDWEDDNASGRRRRPAPSGAHRVRHRSHREGRARAGRRDRDGPPTRWPSCSTSGLERDASPTTATGYRWPRPSWWTRPAWSAPRPYIG